MEIENINILIVEDEGIVALDIDGALKDIGVKKTTIANSYQEAYDYFKKDSFDLVISDINLEEKLTGIDLAKKYKEIKPIEIIFITAYNDTNIISQAVQVEPLGYLNKPFNRNDLKPLILLALVKINNRLQQENITLIDGYSVNFTTYEITYEDKIKKLNANELLLLKVLYENSPNVVSFSELEHKIWNQKTVSNSALRTLLYRLRSKLDKNLIETIPNSGVRLKTS